ncbi:MAG TPA: hypothetical protein VMU50_07430, partial [Polyangia bacterium]|nr:hypothetical protein [Polyangia bacterium]
MEKMMRTVLVALVVTVVAACEGPQGPPGAPGKDGTNGKDGDEPKGRFWVCQVSNDFSKASTLDRYELATGTRVESHALAMAGAVCNDVAIDAGGNLYGSDSFFSIERLAGGAA